MSSQKRALTWLMPTRATASRREASGGKPVSSAMTSAMESAHCEVTRSTRSRTAGSLVRSDSKTSRNAPPSLAT